MTWYNLTFIDNASGPTVLVEGLVQNSGGWFIGSLLIFLWLILFIRFKENGAINANLAASFIISLLAGLAFGFGAISAYMLIFPVSLLAVAIVFKVWGQG